MYRRQMKAEMYMLSLEEFSKIPEGTLLMDVQWNLITKPDDYTGDILIMSSNGKKFTKLGWTHELAKRQGLEDLFLLFLLGS